MKSSEIAFAPAPPARRGRDELAFLPAALEIVETPPSPTGRAIAATIAVLFCTALAWASFSRIDIISSAKGQIEPSGRVKIVQPLETGVVRAIHVGDGQEVAAGDLLVELDPTADEADLAHIQSDLLSEQVAVARLRAALSDAPDPVADFRPPPRAPADLVAIERRHLADQMTAQREKLAALEREQAEKDAQRETAAAAIAGLKATIPVRASLQTLYKDLYDRGLGSKVQYLQSLESLLDQQHQLAAQEGRFREAEAASAAVAESRKQAIAEFRSDRSDELAKSQAKAAGFDEDLIKAKKRVNLLALRAPVDGVVQQLAIHTIGGVVTPAQQLMVVVPRDRRLEITAMIPNREIGFIRKGQKAEIKIDAFNYTQYGLLHGRVVSVSRDSIAAPRRPGQAEPAENGSEREDSEPTGEQLLYAAHIALDHTQMLINGQRVDLRPGMAVTAEIKTGSHRIISYLLSPLARYAHESLRER